MGFRFTSPDLEILFENRFKKIILKKKGGEEDLISFDFFLKKNKETQRAGRHAGKLWLRQRWSRTGFENEKWEGDVLSFAGKLILYSLWIKCVRAYNILCDLRTGPSDLESDSHWCVPFLIQRAPAYRRPMCSPFLGL